MTWKLACAVCVASNTISTDSSLVGVGNDDAVADAGRVVVGDGLVDVDRAGRRGDFRTDVGPGFGQTDGRLRVDAAVTVMIDVVSRAVVDPVAIGRIDLLGAVDQDAPKRCVNPKIRIGISISAITPAASGEVLLVPPKAARRSRWCRMSS